MRRFLGAMSAAVLAVGVVAGCAADESDHSGDAAAEAAGVKNYRDAVTVLECKASDIKGYLEAKVKVTNNTEADDVWDMSVQALDAEGKEIGGAGGRSDLVPKGGSAVVELLGPLKDKDALKECRPLLITRKSHTDKN